MNYDIVLAGVGGQGVLSVAAVVATAALEEGLAVKQSETHGMSQRGGSVVAHLRLADAPIASDLIAHRSASMVLGLEPLESLRQLAYLAADGVLVTSSKPVTNIPDYPPLDELLAEIRRLPRSVVFDADALARRAGSGRAVNMVMVGAASPFLPLAAGTIERSIAERFRSKGEDVLEVNRKAFRAGRQAAG